MPADQQSQAIANANAIMALAAQAIMLYNQIRQRTDAWNDDNSLEVLAFMGTAAQNADGTLGKADTNPDPAHPLNTGIYTTLARAVSAKQLANAVSLLETMAAFMNGDNVGANPGMRGTLNSIAAG